MKLIVKHTLRCLQYVFHDLHYHFNLDAFLNKVFKPKKKYQTQISLNKMNRSSKFEENQNIKGNENTKNMVKECTKYEKSKFKTFPSFLYSEF